MEFESPDVMKDFPGLFASESSKKGSNDSDYSDEPDKLAKKDLLKRKDKKDKKDKERGYAALEGESSADENDSRSPSKIKKSKTFKFSTKSKEKREKSREKDLVDKKSKDKEKKSDKKIEKEKVKAEKKEKGKCKSADEHADIADGMPIFGVPLDVAVERSRCHDGVDIPLPVRACIDYIQSTGLSMEGVYKMSGTKAKVLQLRKLYNQRELVDLTEYEIPIATSLLKLFLRDLPEPIFTTDLLVRFEEAGAILNVGTREKHLKILVENLPVNNKLLLSWILIHLDDVVLNERLNKMNITTMVGALGPTLHTSSRLLTALLHHCRALFPTVILEKYLPPLSGSAQLPRDLDRLEMELNKQESLLSQIHSEMNAGYITKTREEFLWEVQRIITQLKRKIKNLQKEKEEKEAVDVPPTLHHQISKEIEIHCQTQETNSKGKKTPEEKKENTPEEEQLPVLQQLPPPVSIPPPPTTLPPNAEDSSESSPPSSDSSCMNTYLDSPEAPASSLPNCLSSSTQTPITQVAVEQTPLPLDKTSRTLERRRMTVDNSIQPNTDDAIALLQFKHSALTALRDRLTNSIQNEKAEVAELRRQLREEAVQQMVPAFSNDPNMEEIMTLLQQENQILEIKKINLVRRIMEQEEMCIDLRSKLILIGSQRNPTSI